MQSLYKTGREGKSGMDRQIDIERLSARFHVRRMTEGDAEEILALCSTNPQYYEACGAPPTREGVLRDLTLCPPGKTARDKYFLGFYEDGGARPTAILDLIADYPEARMAWIGLFMVDGARAGKGLGTALLQEILAALQAEGFTVVRLGYQNSNPQSGAFWTKNGFRKQKEVAHEYGAMIVAQRLLP